MATYLGLDTGGSHSRFALVDDQGAHQRTGTGPPVQVAQQGIEPAAAGLRALVAAAGAVPTCIVAGVAGAGTAEVRRALEQALAGLPLHVTGDIETAAASALAECAGIALWAGTGSFAVLRDPGGALHRVGGRGFLLGDEGSAFDLVRRAAQAVVRSAEGRAPATTLATTLVPALGATSAVRLGPAMQSQSPRQVAAACPVVIAAATAGDAVATGVLRAGAAELAVLAAALVSRLDVPASELPVVLGGGLLLGAAAYRRAVEAALQQHGLTVGPEATVGPAEGAARLARAVHLGLEPLASWVRHGAA